MKPRLLSNFFWLNVALTIMLACRQPLAAQNPVSQSQAPSLKVMAVAQQQRVHEYQPITLNIQVINISKTVQSFRVMSCSWPLEWESSDPRIFLPGFACAANAPVTVTLLPGDYYKKTLEMHQFPEQFPVVGQKLELGRLSFRIGFTPEDNLRLLRGRITGPTYWSEPVVLQIIK